MPASTLITAGSGAILVPSALSYPQATDPTIYLPYDSPQVITSSGTWKHPKPGFALSITYLLIGGGGSTTDYSSGVAASGGGGSGRISPFTTAIVTTNLEVTIGAGATASASVGGTTTFNGLSVAGGSFGTAPVNAGGAGGDGGCGGGGGAGGHTSPATGGNGGNGLDYTGGGGGSSGTPGTPTLGGTPGYTTRGPYHAQRGQGGSSTLASGGTTGGGWPNGAGSIYNTGKGGDLTLIFPWVRGYGAGGTSLEYNSAHNDGYSGAVFIFYNRP